MKALLLVQYILIIQPLACQQTNHQLEGYYQLELEDFIITLTISESEYFLQFSTFYQDMKVTDLLSYGETFVRDNDLHLKDSHNGFVLKGRIDSNDIIITHGYSFLVNQKLKFRSAKYSLTTLNNMRSGINWAKESDASNQILQIVNYKFCFNSSAFISFDNNTYELVINNLLVSKGPNSRSGVPSDVNRK